MVRRAVTHAIVVDRDRGRPPGVLSALDVARARLGTGLSEVPPPGMRMAAVPVRISPWWVAALCLVLSFAAAGRAAAQPARVFTIAAAESTGAAVPLLCGAVVYCELPGPWPEVWTATERRIDGNCLDHYPDGSVLLSSDGRPIRMTPDGRMRVLPVSGLELGWESEDGTEASVPAETTAVAPDGGVIVGGLRGVAGFGPDGALRWVRPDGGADGVRHGAAPEGVPATEADIGQPFDVFAFPDGSFLIVGGQPVWRILRVDAAGIIHRFAGGRGRWREGAPATGVSIGRIAAVRALDDGRVLLATDRGVLEIGLDHRIRTLIRGARHPFKAGFVSLQEAGTDGRAVAGATLPGIADVDLLPDARVTVLAAVPAQRGRVWRSWATPWASTAWLSRCRVRTGE
jgi:hypothetical protein